MRLLFLGDVVGRLGRNALCEQLPALRERLAADFVIVNGENSAGGFGITEQIFQNLHDAGADVVTAANHVGTSGRRSYSSRGRTACCGRSTIPSARRVRAPGCSGPRTAPKVLVMNALGRIFMDALDDPFLAVEREIAACPLLQGADAIFIDIHAEATSEKQALAAAFDGRVSAVIGTHTHVPTADARIMPGGTAFMTDVGMCGDYDSVIGMEKGEPVHRFLTRIPSGRFTPAMGPATICGVLIETDDATGLAASIEPVQEGAPLGGGRTRTPQEG